MSHAHSSPGSCHPAQLIEEPAELWDQHKRIVLILQQQQHKIRNCTTIHITQHTLLIRYWLYEKEPYKLLRNKQYRVFQSKLYKTSDKDIM